jgi:hypothetical protein
MTLSRVNVLAKADGTAAIIVNTVCKKKQLSASNSAAACGVSYLSVARLLPSIPLRPDGVQLINEDNRSLEGQ